MFVVMQDPRVTWPVKVQWPVDGGRFEEQAFSARFRVLADDERARITEENSGDFTAVLRAAVVGWGDILDEEKLPIPFSADRLDRLLAMPATVAGLTRAYAEILSGKAAEGN